MPFLSEESIDSIIELSDFALGECSVHDEIDLSIDIFHALISPPLAGGYRIRGLNFIHPLWPIMLYLINKIPLHKPPPIKNSSSLLLILRHFIIDYIYI